MNLGGSKAEALEKAQKKRKQGEEVIDGSLMMFRGAYQDVSGQDASNPAFGTSRGDAQFGQGKNPRPLSGTNALAVQGSSHDIHHFDPTGGVFSGTGNSYGCNFVSAGGGTTSFASCATPAQNLATARRFSTVAPLLQETSGLLSQLRTENPQQATILAARGCGNSGQDPETDARNMLAGFERGTLAAQMLKMQTEDPEGFQTLLDQILYSADSSASAST
jgi:hypothetical protein